MKDLTTHLGPMTLRSPLIAASGTVGSVVDFAATVDFSLYGAAVAKSVSDEPWPGREEPRLGHAGTGMLNAIGIQNPGIGEWVATVGPRLTAAGVPVWGSAVGHAAKDFATVAAGLAGSGVSAVEVNLSCPNIEDGSLFALDPGSSREVVAAVRSATDLPIGAKLSPNAEQVVKVSDAVIGAGADWVVLTNTAWGAAIDVESRRPILSSVVGGYSGPPLKPIAMRCVWEVAQSLPGVPIVGCGGVSRGLDVVEYLLAGASAVALGSIHFAEPRAARRIQRELAKLLDSMGAESIEELIGGARPW